MIELEESDFSSLQSFELRARFIDAGHDDVMTDVRQRVRPIGELKAAELAKIASGFCGDGVAHAVTFRSDDRPVVVTDRLRELPPASDTRIVVSWNPTTAALTDWMLFTARWSQFCHAAADDVAVWPLTGGWNLCYRRYEVFQFRSRPQPA